MRTVDPAQWPVRAGRTRLVNAPGPGPREAQLRASLVDAFEELWQRSPIRGHRFVQESENSKVRGVYICLLVCAVACGVAVIAASHSALAGRPPVATSLLAGGRHLHRIDFPAVALCATNLVSRAALRDYVHQLSEMDGNRTYSLRELERHLTAFGALSDMAGAPLDLDVRFASFLARLGQRNVSDIAYRLAPRCSDLLLRCTWRARVMPCERLFAARATPHGYCCAFNARYQPEDAGRPALRLVMAGRDAGLGVVVHEDSTDFAYVRRSTAGLEVMIWEGSEYPMPEGGGVALRVAHLNASVYLTLNARELHAHPSLSDVSERKRGCRMPSVGGGAARDSLAWCLLRCRVDAVRVLCACTPHLYKPLYQDNDYETCSLDHLLCLSKYRETLQFFNTEVAARAGSGAEEQESEVGLLCPRCRYDCERLQYAVRSAHSQYRHLHKLFKNILSRDISFVNTSVIRVYFARSDQDLLVAETNQRWFQIFAMQSSQWVFVTGVTAVSVLQLLYHAGLRWRHHYRRRPRLLASRARQWSDLAAPLRPAATPRRTLQFDISVDH